MKHKADVSKILADFEKVWTFDIEDLHKPSTEQVLKNLIATCSAEHRTRLENEFFGYGPITPLLDRTDIQEIIVDGTREIWIERLGCFEKHEDVFLSEITFKNFIDRICSEAHVHVDLSHPFANGRWQNYRLHLVCAPISQQAYHLTLRRHPKNPWTIPNLESAGWCTSSESAVLRSLISTNRNVLVIGPTGSGKTSVLGACLNELEPHERVVILEDTDELPIPNSTSTKLLTRLPTTPSLPAIDLAELVRQSLRMRPLRLVLGEVRGPEAKELLLALATSHKGSWGTLHAEDPQQALLRLEMLIQMGAPQWSVQAIRQLLKLSVDAIVVCGFDGGQRRLKGLFRVAAIESFGLLLEPMTAGD